MQATDQVRAVFEDPEPYLKGSRLNITIRAETVREFVGQNFQGRILDIGCGDGSISLPLLQENTHLTLLDLSGAMLSAARQQVPPEWTDSVSFVHDAFMEASLPYKYDLILCIGILAYVKEPRAMVAKIVSLLRPGGRVITQVTDSSHFRSRVMRKYLALRRLIKPEPYDVTLISADKVIAMFAENGMTLKGLYRYSEPLPGMSRFLGEHFLYRCSRGLHGYYPHGRNAIIGNEIIFQFCLPEEVELP